MRNLGKIKKKKVSIQENTQCFYIQGKSRQYIRKGVTIVHIEKYLWAKQRKGIYIQKSIVFPIQYITIQEKQCFCYIRNTHKFWGEPKKKKCLYIYMEIHKFQVNKVLFYIYRQNTLYRKHITEKMIFPIYIRKTL